MDWRQFSLLLLGRPPSQLSSLVVHSSTFSKRIDIRLVEFFSHSHMPCTWTHLRLCPIPIRWIVYLLGKLIMAFDLLIDVHHSKHIRAVQYHTEKLNNSIIDYRNDLFRARIKCALPIFYVVYGFRAMLAIARAILCHIRTKIWPFETRRKWREASSL